MARDPRVTGLTHMGLGLRLGLRLGLGQRKLHIHRPGQHQAPGGCSKRREGVLVLGAAETIGVLQSMGRRPQLGCCCMRVCVAQAYRIWRSQRCIHGPTPHVVQDSHAADALASPGNGLAPLDMLKTCSHRFEPWVRCEAAVPQDGLAGRTKACALCSVARGVGGVGAHTAAAVVPLECTVNSVGTRSARRVSCRQPCLAVNQFCPLLPSRPQSLWTASLSPQRWKKACKAAQPHA